MHDIRDELFSFRSRLFCRLGDSQLQVKNDCGVGNCIQPPSPSKTMMMKPQRTNQTPTPTRRKRRRLLGKHTIYREILSKHEIRAVVGAHCRVCFHSPVSGPHRLPYNNSNKVVVAEERRGSVIPTRSLPNRFLLVYARPSTRNIPCFGANQHRVAHTHHHTLGCPPPNLYSAHRSRSRWIQTPLVTKQNLAREEASGPVLLIYSDSWTFLIAAIICGGKVFSGKSSPAGSKS